jgi:HPt (histidine-containing phosphotransfer) domain-containing protein
MQAGGKMNSSLAEKNLYYLNSLRNSIGIDDEMVSRFCSSFLHHGPDYIHRMTDALETRNGREFRRLAHSLKSTLNMIGAQDLVEQAKTLDHLGERGSWEPIPPIFSRFSADMTLLCENIRSIRSLLLPAE